MLKKSESEYYGSHSTILASSSWLIWFSWLFSLPTLTNFVSRQLFVVKMSSTKQRTEENDQLVNKVENLAAEEADISWWKYSFDRCPETES